MYMSKSFIKDADRDIVHINSSLIDIIIMCLRVGVGEFLNTMTCIVCQSTLYTYMYLWNL